MLMEMHMYYLQIYYRKEIGLMIELKAMEHIIMLMEPNMKENGLKINNTEREEKCGLMEHCIQEIMLMEKRMVKENFNGVMELLMKESLKIIILKVTLGQRYNQVLESMFGLMEGNIKEIGKIIKCMAKEILFGRMENNIVVKLIIKTRGIF